MGGLFSVEKRLKKPGRSTGRRMLTSVACGNGRSLLQSGQRRIERWLSPVLSENIRAIRKAKGLSQEELAIKLNVVRQTISKWEQGLSVPDSDLLIAIAQALETPVSTLLGETVTEPEADDLAAIAQKLERINVQLARQKAKRRNLLHWLCFALCAAIVAAAAVLYAFPSPYLDWDYSAPETAVMGVAFHACEWLFVRLAPVALVVAAAGYFLTRKKA